MWGGIVQFLVTGWTVRGSNPGWARYSAHTQTFLVVHPTTYTLGIRSFPGVKRPRRGANNPPHLARDKRKSRAIPLNLFSAFMAGYRVNCKLNCFSTWLRAIVGQDIIAEVPRSHSDTLPSAGLLWTCDQPDAETST